MEKRPGKDDYQLYDENNVVVNGTPRWKYACRQENDGWATASEDIYNDGSFNAAAVEQYHEYVIDLADTRSPFIDTTAKLVAGNGWYRYRLPLHPNGGRTIDVQHRHEVGGLGADDWSNIRMVRIVWDSLDANRLTSENQIIMDGIQFVGYQWQAVKDSSGGSNMVVSTIGTATSNHYDSSLATTSLIHRQLDQSNVLEPEQSLQLLFDSVSRKREAIAQRSFINQPLSVVAYDSITLAVYGNKLADVNYSGFGPLYKGRVKFVFRFGSDSATYYECRDTLQPNWNNYVCVNLKKLSDLKLAWLTHHSPIPPSIPSTEAARTG